METRPLPERLTQLLAELCSADAHDAEAQSVQAHVRVHLEIYDCSEDARADRHRRDYLIFDEDHGLVRPEED